MKSSKRNDPQDQILKQSADLFTGLSTLDGKFQYNTDK